MCEILSALCDQPLNPNLRGGLVLKSEHPLLLSMNSAALSPNIYYIFSEKASGGSAPWFMPYS